MIRIAGWEGGDHQQVEAGRIRRFGNQALLGPCGEVKDVGHSTAFTVFHYECCNSERARARFECCEHRRKGDIRLVGESREKRRLNQELLVTRKRGRL